MYLPKRFMLVAAGLLSMTLAVGAFAAAQVRPCEPGTLADYEKLGAQGCAIADKHFFNFTYHPASDGLPADAISVTPGTVTESDEPALLLEAAWSTPSPDSLVSYNVEVLPGGKPVSGVSLQMRFGQITGTGQAKVSAELHQLTDSPRTCGASELTLNVFLGANRPKKPQDDGRLKDPARQLCVVTPVSLAPGKNGSANLKGFMTVFHSRLEQSASASNHSLASSTGRER
jgi:hypothetical protein